MNEEEEDGRELRAKEEAGPYEGKAENIAEKVKLVEFSGRPVTHSRCLFPEKRVKYSNQLHGQVLDKKKKKQQNFQDTKNRLDV